MRRGLLCHVGSRRLCCGLGCQGGQGAAAFGGAWRVQVGQGGHGVLTVGLGAVRCGLVRRSRSGWVGSVQVCSGLVWRSRCFKLSFGELRSGKATRFW